jgi:RNA polymerase sigma factor (sigma-70 family)
MNATVSHAQVAAAKAGNATAAADIISAVEPMIAKLAHTMCGKFHTEDALSEGRLAVYECLSTFDPERGAAFTTHAYQKASMAISEFVSSNTPGPTVPGRTVRRYNAVMEQANGDFDVALALVAGASDRTEHGSVAGFMATHTSMQAPKHTDRVVTDGDEGETVAVEIQDGYTDVEEEATNKVVVRDLLAGCSEREVLILSMTYGIGGQTEMKDQDIADTMGISRSRVVTIRKAAQLRLSAENTDLAGVV